MSDIPVGSPPVPPGRHAAPGGWYPDPIDARQERYWDGWQWSRNTRPSEAPTQQPYPPQHLRQPHPQQAYGQGAPGNPVARPGTVVLTADGVPVSGWWWRVLAMLVDGLITGVISIIIASPIYLRMFAAFGDYFNEVLAAAQAGEPQPPQPDVTTFVSTTDNVVLVVISLLVAMAYNVAFLRWKAATPGKLIVGLRVVPVDQGHFVGPLPWNTIVIRAAVWVLPASTAWLYLVRIADALFPLWQPKRQALHDLAAKTQVVKIN